MSTLDKYGPEVQKVSADTPVQDIIALLKRDGGVFIKSLIPESEVDKAYDECRERLDSDVDWSGNFFPSQFSNFTYAHDYQHGYLQRRRNVRQAS